MNENFNQNPRFNQETGRREDFTLLQLLSGERSLLAEESVEYEKTVQANEELPAVSHLHPKREKVARFDNCLEEIEHGRLRGKITKGSPLNRTLHTKNCIYNMDNMNNNGESSEKCAVKKESSRPEFFLHIINSSAGNNSVSRNEQQQQCQKQDHHDCEECSEIETARQKFKEISESIDNEERNLKVLEERRQKLERDMERLQKDIETEKELFRRKIEADLARKAELSENSSDEISPNTSSSSFSKIDPLSVNTEEITERIREYREAVEDSQLHSILHEDDADIKRLRENLVTYKRALAETRKEKIVKQKRKAAAKIFQRHLEEVDLKCSEQIDKLTSIQKTIGNINANGSGDLELFNLH